MSKRSDLLTSDFWFICSQPPERQPGVRDPGAGHQPRAPGAELAQLSGKHLLGLGMILLTGSSLALSLVITSTIATIRRFKLRS